MYYKMDSAPLDFSTAPAPEDKGIKDIVKKVLPVVVKVLPVLLS